MYVEYNKVKKEAWIVEITEAKASSRIFFASLIGTGCESH